MIQRLFVYGTLAPGEPNGHVLAEIDGSWLDGCVRGRLENAGWGAQMGYPAIKLDPDASPIPGHVFESENLSDHWDALDAFEGAEYERVLTKVQISDRSWIDAYIYVSRH